MKGLMWKEFLWNRWKKWNLKSISDCNKWNKEKYKIKNFMTMRMRWKMSFQINRKMKKKNKKKKFNTRKK